MKQSKKQSFSDKRNRVILQFQKTIFQMKNLNIKLKKQQKFKN